MSHNPMGLHGLLQGQLCPIQNYKAKTHAKETDLLQIMSIQLLF
jgi:hypothetical protein